MRLMLLLAVASLLLTACTGSSSDTSTPTASIESTTPNTASAPSDDPIAQATAAVRAAYSGYWAAQVQAGAHPNRPIPKTLSRYSIDKAQGDAQATIVLLREQGIVVKGEPELAPVITTLSLSEQPSAAITDCVDSTDWKPVYKNLSKIRGTPHFAFRMVQTEAGLSARRARAGGRARSRRPASRSWP
jgi:hypothetical protein